RVLVDEGGEALPTDWLTLATPHGGLGLPPTDPRRGRRGRCTGPFRQPVDWLQASLPPPKGSFSPSMRLERGPSALDLLRDQMGLEGCPTVPALPGYKPL